MILEFLLKLVIESTEASSYGGFFAIKEKYLTENTIRDLYYWILKNI